MYPVLFHIGPFAVGSHDFFVGLGVLAATVVFVLEMRRRRMSDERLWAVVAGALVGGAVLGRLGTWAEHLDLRRNASFVEAWLYGNRSILGGLLGAYLGAVVAKRLVGYRGRTGDLFAPAVAIGMAIGRIGCFLAERPGAATGLPWGVHVPGSADLPDCPACAAGQAMHPSFLYEIGFHLIAFAALIALRRRIQEPGELLKLYLLAYAGFRFAVEFTRGNEAVWLGLSRSQWFVLAVAPLLVIHCVRQYRKGVYAGVFSRTRRPLAVST